MKKYGNRIVILRALLTLCAVLGWWGALYPEFSLTPDTYRIVDAAGREVECEASEEELYREIFHGDRSRVRFRSRLLTNLTALWEQGRGNENAG